MKFWDYNLQDLTVPLEEAIDYYEPNLIHHAQSTALVWEKLQSNTPYCIVRIGDTDANFLGLKDTTPREREIIKSLMFFSGIDARNLPDPQEFAHIIEKADIVCCQQPDMGPTRFWGPTLDALHKWNLLSHLPRYLEICSFYKLAGEGLLFQAFWGKRIVLVGAKAEAFYHYYYQNQHYRDTFPFLGLENITLSALVPTPDMGFHAMNYRHDIEAQVRKTYPPNRISIYLAAGFSLSIWPLWCGMTAILV
ncbi:MAG: hypothetical protein K2X66_10125 [Cyanobacteria bacterium]|nr:hypothetical protein [Cyanobacteriota bacterium]